MPKLPLRILVHTATLISFETGAEPTDWFEGEPGDDPAGPTAGAVFPCVLFLPAPAGEAVVEQSYRPRTIQRPTVLFDPNLVVGTTVTKDDELMIAAPELATYTGASTARWQVEGDPQPFGKPGSVIGVLCILKAVHD